MSRPPWVNRAAGTHPLNRELRIARLAGWPLLAVTVLSGIVCGLAGIAVWGSSAPPSGRWLAVPAVIPPVYSLVRGRSLLAGAIGGFFAALITFLTLGLYAVWRIACFIITFAGEC